MSDDGRLIGVNTFKSEGEGLNYAISVDDVRTFLAAQGATPASGRPAPSCTGKVLFEGRDGAAYIKRLSSMCDNITDIVYILPDDRAAPLVMTLDRQRRNQPDIAYDVVYVDPTRTGKWQFSLWDVGLDNTFPLKGIHQNGELVPIRFEKRCPGTAGTNLRCL